MVKWCVGNKYNPLLLLSNGTLLWFIQTKGYFHSWQYSNGALRCSVVKGIVPSIPERVCGFLDSFSTKDPEENLPVSYSVV